MEVLILFVLVLYLKSKYDLYGISFSYGQRASREIKWQKSFSKILGLKEHKILTLVL